MNNYINPNDSKFGIVNNTFENTINDNDLYMLA